MMDSKSAVGALALLLAAPLALAQNDTGNDDTDRTIDPPNDIKVDIRDSDGTQESAAGMSGTTVLILIVVAVLVIALIAALAGRDPGHP